MNNLKPTEAAYIAGLVDADGTVTLTRKHRNENRRPALSISNTDRNLLIFVKKAVGAGTITGKKIAKAHHTPSFVYGIYNRQALDLLHQIRQHLKTYKAIRAELILLNYLAVTPRNGKYTEKLKIKRRAFEEQVLRVKT